MHVSSTGIHEKMRYPKSSAKTVAFP